MHRPYRQWSALKRSQTIDLYLADQERQSVTSLAKLVGVPPSTVHTWLTKAGVTVHRMPAEAARRKVARKRAAELRLQGGRTIPQIAEELSVPADTIARWLKADNVRAPSKRQIYDRIFAQMQVDDKALRDLINNEPTAEDLADLVTSQDAAAAEFVASEDRASEDDELLRRAAAQEWDTRKAAEAARNGRPV